MVCSPGIPSRLTCSSGRQAAVTSAKPSLAASRRPQGGSMPSVLVFQPFPASVPRPTLAAMPRDLPPTTLAVADAVTHYRQLRELTLDELSFVLAQDHGHGLTTEELRRIEDAERPATVDDLVALAAALGTTPSVLLSHIPLDLPDPSAPLATGLPGDVQQPELRAWLEGRTALDHRSRLQYAIDRRSAQSIRYAHLEDQLGAAHEEMQALGELALQEADAPQVTALEDRIREGEHELVQAEVALAMAESHLQDLKSRRVG